MVDWLARTFKKRVLGRKRIFLPIGVGYFLAEGRKILKRNHQGSFLESERRVTTTHCYRTFRSYGGGSDEG